MRNVPRNLSKVPDMRGPLGTSPSHFYGLHYLGLLHQQTILPNGGVASALQKMSQYEIQGREQREKEELSAKEEKR